MGKVKGKSGKETVKLCGGCKRDRTVLYRWASQDERSFES